VTEDPAGKFIPVYIRQLDEYYREEQQSQHENLRILTESVEHIKQIVAMQQTYARSSTLYEKLTPIDVIEDALRIQAGALSRHGVTLVKEYEPLPAFHID